MDTIFPWIILLPLTGAIATFLVPRAWVIRTGMVTALLTSCMVFAAAYFLHQNGPVHYAVGSWAAPLGIRLYLDGLACVMLLLTAVSGIFISVYACEYFKDKTSGVLKREGIMFWPLWLFLWGAMNALYVSGDLFNMYVLLELLGLSAVGLVALAGTRTVLIAGMRYLIAAMLGSMSYLLGVAFLYAMHSALDTRMMGALIEPGMGAAIAFALMTIGLLLKTALFPLHFWLPPAHAGSSAPVSAILSALVVKGSFYLLLRLWFDVFHNVVTIPVGQFLGALGALAVLWGSIQAIRQQRLKMLVAYSTVAQLGYLFAVFPVTAGAPPTDGVLGQWVIESGKGTLYHALAHAFSKASIFLAAGIMVHALGTDQLSRMRGMAERLPLTTFAMALAGVSLMGLPPSGGFIGKWLMMHAVLGSGQWWWAVVIMTGSLLTAGYMFMMLRQAFQPCEDPSLFKPVPKTMEWAALILAFISIGIGIRAADVLDLLMIGSPFLIEPIAAVGGAL